MSTDMRVANLTRELAEKQAIIDQVVQNVMAYDGCNSGKRDFLESCGIDPLRGMARTVVVTVAFTIDWDETDGAEDIAEQVQGALDGNCSAVLNSSAYVTAMGSTDDEPRTLGCAFRADDDMLRVT